MAANKYHLERLEVGDSLLIKDPHCSRGNLYKRAQQLGVRFTVSRDATGGLSVLRTS